MNLGNEVTVKNFHVLGSNQAVSVVKKDGKMYFTIDDVATTSPYAHTPTLTTDQFSELAIKRVRLTKPTTPAFKKWTITIPTLPTDGKFLIVYMHYENLYGYGITDTWEKYAAVMKKASITSKCAMAYLLAKQINAQYVNGMRPVTAKAYTKVSGTTTEITEANLTAGSVSDGTGSGDSVFVELVDNTFTIQTPNRRRMEMSMDPQPITMYITTNVHDSTTNFPIQSMEDSWCKEVAAAAAAGKFYYGDDDSSHSYKNDYLIWGLEKVSQLKSTDTMPDQCSGFIGYDSYMDGQTLNTKNYWVLDIAYETAPKMGVPASRNMKELSFAMAAGDNDAIPEALISILNDINMGLDENNNVVQYAEITVRTDDEDYGSVAGGGTYRIGSYVTLTATPAATKTFQYWKIDDGDTSHTENPMTIVVNKNTTYKAIFV